jgi:hypothetical protein
MKIRQQVLTIDGERYDLYVDAEQFGDATVHYDQDNVAKTMWTTMGPFYRPLHLTEN